MRDRASSQKYFFFFFIQGGRRSIFQKDPEFADGRKINLMVLILGTYMNSYFPSETEWLRVIRIC